jgi:hypothetical protein
MSETLFSRSWETTDQGIRGKPARFDGSGDQKTERSRKARQGAKPERFFVSVVAQLSSLL